MGKLNWIAKVAVCFCCGEWQRRRCLRRHSRRSTTSARKPIRTDGIGPVDALIQATNGSLYGTTEEGGFVNCRLSTSCGTVFKITTGGSLTTLYSFCSQSGCPDGNYPIAGLVQDTNANLYGTTLWNGGGRSTTMEQSSRSRLAAT